ncbi:MAG: hypothetical protein ACTHJW_11695 [Streptosporangiaceae bacterium]
MPEEGLRLAQEFAPFGDEFQFTPASGPDTLLAEFQDPRARQAAMIGECVATTTCAPASAILYSRGEQTEAGHERERRVRFVHQVEPGLVDPGAQDLQESLAGTVAGQADMSMPSPRYL